MEDLLTGMGENGWAMDPRSHRLLLLFAATTIGPAMGLGWLGWRLMEQDRALERQRVQERREHAADLAAAALGRKIAELEDGGKIPEGVAVVMFGKEGVRVRRGVLLPFQPEGALRRAESGVFARAEELEFREGGMEQGMALLRDLAASKDASIRGGALLRLARTHRKRGEADAAMRVLGELAEMGNVVVDGVAAGLLAAQGRALLLESMGRVGELREVAARLAGELREGRWLVSRTTFAFAREQVRKWMGGRSIGEVEPERVTMAEAVESVWRDWPETAMRRTFWDGERAVLIVAEAAAGQLVVRLAGERFLRSEWLAELKKLPAAGDVGFALTDGEGHSVLGNVKVQAAQQSLRIASATRLPWTVHAASLGDGTMAYDRSPMLVAAVLMMAVLIVGGGYLIYRAVSRELRVAKLQSDFVAAVSHEFRTPLTTIRQMSEMLVQDRVSSDERRRQFYGVLLRESDRLHRLVDGLLNFGRMEAGQIRYQFELVDPAMLVRDVVTDFRVEAAKAGYAVDLRANGMLTPIRADRESLARVFWNLLDNAVKYSPGCHTVWVEVAGAGKRVEVKVRDRGIGIPAAEQRQIFRKFVRGAEPKATAIQGTGVGLAMARQIVEAHHGEIVVKSKPGEGSEFTVLLPLAE